MRRRRPSALRLWLGHTAALAAVIAVTLGLLWAARLACEANPACPWPVLWRSR